MRTIFNFLGPLTNPAGRDAPADRRLRPPLPGDDRRGARRARLRARAGRLAPTDGLDELSDRRPRPAWSRSRDGGTERVVRRPRRTSASTRAELERDRRRRRPAENAAVVARGARRRAGPGARRRRCSTPAPRSTSAAAPTTSTAGVERAARGDRLGRRARRRSSGSSRADAASWRRAMVAVICAMSRLEQLVAAAREDVARRKRAGLGRASSSAASARRDGSRPFNEALVAPGLSLIAEFKRRSPSRRRDPRRAPTSPTSSRAYERGGAAALSVLTEERALRRLARRPARPRARRAACRSCARTSSSTPTSSTRRRSHGADAVLLIVAALDDEDLGALYEEARALDLDCLVEVHDERELERALELDADVIGINNRNLADFTVDIETHLRAAHRRPGRARRSSPSPATTRASSSTSSSGSASTRS